jgi:hypothetical protein
LDRLIVMLGENVWIDRGEGGGHPGHPLYLPADSPLLPYESPIKGRDQ